MNKKEMPELIVALDFDDINRADEITDLLNDSVLWFKVGKQMFTRYGPHIVAMLKKKNKRVFLDLKFHDIPNTVSRAVLAAADIGADMINLHAVGGIEMLRAGRSALDSQHSDALLIAITVLTSLDNSSFRECGFTGDIADQVKRLAILAKECGLDGVVTSAHEISDIRNVCGKDFILVVPGIRPSGHQKQDQKRVTTSVDAAKFGADFIVVGRPITQSDDPVALTRKILQDLEG